MIMNKTYHVTSGDLLFGASVRKPEKVLQTEPQQYHVEFGGKQKCIDITIYKNQEKAWLTGLRHNVACAFNKELPNGKDGTVVMLNSAMMFIKKKFPYVSHLEFLDNSHIKCKLKTRVPLDSYYIAKYGNTWYGMMFDARPAKMIHNECISQLNGFLDSQEDKSKYSFQQFFAEHINLYVTRAYDKMKHKDKYIVRLREVLQPVFDTSLTFREFIKKVDETHPRNCIVFYGWLDEFLANSSEVPFQYMHWIIDVPLACNIRIKKVDEAMFSVEHPDFDFLNTMSLHDGGGTLPF